MASAVVYHGIQGIYFERPYPLNTFLFLPSDRFMDFFNDMRYAAQFGPTADMVAYSAFIMAALRAIGIILPDNVAFVALAGTFAATLSLAVWRYATARLDSPVLRLHYVLLLGLLTYPVLFAIDRGNLDMLVFIALAAFFYLHYARASRWSWVFLAAAIAAKYYPATLLVLFLCDRRYRELAFTIGGAILLTLVSAVGLQVASGLSVTRVLSAVATQLGRHDAYARTVDSVQHGHSLWGLLSWVVGTRGASAYSQGMELVGVGPWSRPYLIAALAIFALLAIYVVRVEKVRWKRVAILVIAFTLLPYESHDYTLIFLYFPIVFFLHDANGSPLDVAYAVLLGLLLVPAGYYTFGSTDVTTSVFVYPIAMTALLLIMVVDGLRCRSSAPAVSPASD